MPLKVKNIAAGYYDGKGRFHPIRASADYLPGVVGEDYKYKKATKKQIREKAKKAEEIARLARAEARKKAAAAKKAAKKAVKKAAKKNPIPVSRWVPAKVKRTRSGDVKIMIPLK